jgi:hypothetical protein
MRYRRQRTVLITGICVHKTLTHELQCAIGEWIVLIIGISVNTYLHAAFPTVRAITMRPLNC